MLVTISFHRKQIGEPVNSTGEGKRCDFVTQRFVVVVNPEHHANKDQESKKDRCVQKMYLR